MEKLPDCEFERYKSIQNYFDFNEPNYYEFIEDWYELAEGIVNIYWINK